MSERGWVPWNDGQWGRPERNRAEVTELRNKICKKLKEIKKLKDEIDNHKREIDALEEGRVVKTR